MTFSQQFFGFSRYIIRAMGQPSKLKGVLGLKGAAFRAHWFPPEFEPSVFPSLDRALVDPSGLLAIGGKVSPDSLLSAFQCGVFAYNEVYQPTKWWAPPIRMVLFPEEMHLQRTIQRLIRNNRFSISFDQAFPEVVEACACPRSNTPESWVLPLIEVFKALHRRGQAFSVEAWDKEGNLAGGVFGLVSNRHLSVESMFTRSNHASKIALAHLCAHLRHWGYPIIDMQTPTPHLASLGCRPISRDEYMAIVDSSIKMKGLPKPWRVEVKPDNDGTPILLDQSIAEVAS